MEQNIPKNIRCIGKAEADRKIFVEEYVVSFLQEMAEKETKPQMVVFYGDGYEKDGCRYFFLTGVAAHKASDCIFGKMDEFYFQTVNKKYFPNLKGIGWYYTECVNGKEDILQILQGLCEQNFRDIKGYYIYFEKNPAMEEYMLHHGKAAGNVKPVEKKEQLPKQSQYTEKKKWKVKGRLLPEGKVAPILAIQILNMVSLGILIICSIIAVSTLNQYDKMKQLEKTVTYLEISMEEQKNLPEE